MYKVLNDEMVNVMSLEWGNFKKILDEHGTEHSNTDEYIRLDLGITVEGIASYTIGDMGNVHFICGGAPGSGKSVLSENLMVALANRYSERELEIWLTDFRGYEFVSKGHDNLFRRVPNVHSCRTMKEEEEYLVAFKDIRSLCEERVEFFRSVGVKSLKDFNTKMRLQGTPERCLPRVLNLVTGIGAINCLSHDDQHSIVADVIHILKYGRTAGVHLGLINTSYREGFPLPEDCLDQFSLRLALRCDEDTSKILLGDSNANTIRNKNGFMYVLSIGEVNPTICKIPFMKPEEFEEEVYRLLS